MEADWSRISRDVRYFDAVLYVLFGYYFGWSPREIDEMDTELVVRCMNVLRAMLDKMGGAGEVTRPRRLKL